MPYSRNPKAYPKQFASAFLRAKDEEQTLELPSIPLATALHHKLNAYRVAVEASYNDYSLREIQISRTGNILTLSNVSGLLVDIFPDEAEPSDIDIDEYLKQLDKANETEQAGKTKDQEQSADSSNPGTTFIPRPDSPEKETQERGRDHESSTPAQDRGDKTS